MQPASPQPRVDRVFSQTKIEQLLPRNNSVLPAGEVSYEAVTAPSLR